MARITVYLSEQELSVLRSLAERDMRGLREQARYMLRLGLLPAIVPTASPTNLEIPTPQSEPVEPREVNHASAR